MRRIKEVYDLLVHGEYQLALSKIDLLNSESLEYKLLKSIYFEQNGEYMKSANLIDQVILICRQDEDTNLLFVSLISKLSVLYRLRLFKETKLVIEEIQNTIEFLTDDDQSNLWR